jgi:hypothetical protein
MIEKALAVLVALVVGWVQACGAQRSAPAAVYVEEVTPPAAWEAIYHEVETCVGMEKGKYDAIRWFVTPEPWGEGSGRTYGLWHVAGGRPSIIIAAWDTAVVRHEALHDILWRNGFKPFRIPADSSNNPEHPMPPFGTCAKRAFP